MEKKMTLTNSIKNCIEKHKAKKRRVLFKKIKTLYHAAYDFYLTLYLIDVEKNQTVDLPAFYYLSGKVICSKAQNQAIEAVKENAINQGIKRINECYKSWLKYRRAILRGC